MVFLSAVFQFDVTIMGKEVAVPFREENYFPVPVQRLTLH